ARRTALGPEPEVRHHAVAPQEGVPLACRGEARAHDIATLVHGGDERATPAQRRQQLRHAAIPQPTLAAFELSRPGTSVARHLSPVVDAHHVGVLSGKYARILELAVAPKERAGDVVAIRAGADNIPSIVDARRPAVAAVTEGVGAAVIEVSGSAEHTEVLDCLAVPQHGVAVGIVLVGVRILGRADNLAATIHGRCPISIVPALERG